MEIFIGIGEDYVDSGLDSLQVDSTRSQSHRIQTLERSSDQVIPNREETLDAPRLASAAIAPDDPAYQSSSFIKLTEEVLGNLQKSEEVPLEKPEGFDDLIQEIVRYEILPMDYTEWTAIRFSNQV